MAAEPNIITIKMESILGGQSPMSHFAGSDQFRASLGIDPGLPAVDNTAVLFKESGVLASGLIRPAAYSSIAENSGTTIASTPMWLKQNPKDGYTYVYDAVGSIYTIGPSYYAALSGLGDLNDGGSARGNGCDYFDNYMYFARDTTIARYGPLNGTPTFIDDYWAGTLGLTALSNTTYPVVEVGSSDNFALNLIAGSLQYAYIDSINQSGLGITGDMSIEMWVKFRSLPSSGSKYGGVNMARVG